MKGLICAGGEATRLGELTRVANKHLLPVGSWPMVYYPLQQLQLAGIRDVLLVTGKGHAGQMIDLLGDGRLAPRGGGDPILEVDLTYKVQTEPGGIAQVVGMARDFAAGAPLVVVLGDNIFEHAQSTAVAEWAQSPSRARIFVKDVDDPENFGVVVRDGDGRVTDIVEKAGVVDTRFHAPPSSHAVVGLYCYPPDVFDVISQLSPSLRGELEITDVNRHYASRGQARGDGGGRLVGRRRQALAAPLRHRAADRGDGREQARPVVTPDVVRFPLRLFEDERGWFCELRRDSALPNPMAQTNVSFSKAGVIRGLHYHERGQDDLFACLRGTARVVVLDRTSGETFTEDIGEENPVALYIPGRHAHGFEALTDILFCYHVTVEYDPAHPDEQTLSWNDPRVAHLWSSSTPTLSARDAAVES